MKPPPSSATAARRGFTLLEVLIAVAILCMVSLALYQFVDTTLRAAAYSEKSGKSDAAFAGLRRLVAAQLAALPAGQDGALIGMTVERNGTRRDVLQLICPAGNALLTPDARGFYETTLDLRELPRGSGRYAFGMERQPWSDDDSDEADDPDDDKPGTSALRTTNLRPGHELARMPGDWVKLMDGVRAVEIAYFDARLNGWVDKWTDQKVLPNLVRLRLTTGDHPEPYEIVTRVPGGGLQHLDILPGQGAAFSNTGVPNQGAPNGSPSYVSPRALH